MSQQTAVHPNVMALTGCEALLQPRLACSIPLTHAPAAGHAGKQRVRHFMASAEPIRAASDAGRSALMAAAQAGDRSAYEMLLRECVPLIKSIARRRGLAADRADDLVQDVLLTLHRARHTYDPHRPFDAWLRVIAERRAIDLLRQTARLGAREVHAPLAWESEPDEGADPAAGLDHSDAAGQVGEALAGLPEKQREAVRYLVLEERSLAQAAALTNRTTGSLKVNLHRALKALRAKMNRV
jgi:RNA polymerase sigma-70 factor (ECF subfamily)